MAGNTVYVQGSYVDVHDNEVVNLSIDKATVKLNENDRSATIGDACQSKNENLNLNKKEGQRNEELTFLLHPSVDSKQEWQIHDEICRLVKRQGIQEICQYLWQLKNEQKVLLPQVAEKAHKELVRLGMPHGDGYSLKTFMKYYKR